MPDRDATCLSFRHRVGGAPGLDVVAAVDRDHLAACADCAAWRDELLAVRSMLASVPTPALPAGFDHALRARLEAAASSAPSKTETPPAPAAEASWVLRWIRGLLTPPRLVFAGSAVALAAAAAVSLAPVEPTPAVLDLQLTGVDADQPIAVRLDLPDGVHVAKVGAGDGAAGGAADAWTQPADAPLRIALAVDDGAGGPVRVHLEQADRAADLELLAEVQQPRRRWPTSLGGADPTLALSPSPTSTVDADGLLSPDLHASGASAPAQEDTMTRSVRTLSLVVALAAAGPAVASPGDHVAPTDDASTMSGSMPAEHAEDMGDMPDLSDMGHDGMMGDSDMDDSDMGDHHDMGDDIEMGDHDAMHDMMDHASGMSGESMDSDDMDDMHGDHGMSDDMSDSMSDHDGADADHDEDMDHDGMDDEDMHDGMMDDSDMGDACDMDEMGDMMGEGGMMDHMDEDMMDHMGDDDMMDDMGGDMGGGSDGMGGGSDDMGGGSGDMGGGSGDMGGGSGGMGGGMGGGH